MRRLTRDDVDRSNLWHLIVHGDLPLPRSIIPPERPFYLWRHLGDPPRYDASGDYAGRLLDALEAAVTETLAAWQPIQRVGVWLSGGIDTSVLLYFVSKIVGPEKVRAYTIRFGERDESEYAKAIADWCDVRLMVRDMTIDDFIGLSREAVLAQRAPIDSSVALFAAKLCRQDGTTRVVSGLGIDELQGGYPDHVNAVDDFTEAENRIYEKCQSFFVWINLEQSKGYVELKFPFLTRPLVNFCRSLPRTQKCRGAETKVRLRSELHKRQLIPARNIEAGRIAGTKGGFTPLLTDWFDRGLREWCAANVPPRRFDGVEKLKSRLLIRHNYWRTLRLATTNLFLDLVEEGAFHA